VQKNKIPAIRFVNKLLRSPAFVEKCLWVNLWTACGKATFACEQAVGNQYKKLDNSRCE
jgi:hypothetical protein